MSKLIVEKRLRMLFLPSVFFIILLFPGAYAQEKVRIIAETDLGGDADDQASFVRFLLYSNDLDIEGIILSRSDADFLQDPVAENPSNSTNAYDMAMDYIDSYGQVLNNLRIHDQNYPSVSYLKSITKAGHNGTTDGENHIISVLKESDSRPIWYTNWGCNDNSTSSLKRVLDRIKAGTVSGLNYSDVMNKLRYVEVYNQDHIGSTHRSNLKFYMDTFHPNMDGDRWYKQWDNNTGMETWLLSNAKNTLCNTYYTTEKEGDTPAWMHLLPNGINVPGKPAWGSWAGRYGWNSTYKMWWCNQRDTWNGSLDRDNTLLRWGGGSKAEDIMDDFKMRVRWADRATYGSANHHPVVSVNGSTGFAPLYLSASASQIVNLNASQSSDPDGNSLSYKWEIYNEISRSGATISNTTASTTTVTMPSSFTSSDTVHVYLRLSDNGEFSLTRYKRVIISGTASAVPNIALNKPVTTSSAQTANPASNLVDGSTSTYWSVTSFGYPKSIMIDLGASYNISSTEFFPYGSRAYKYTIEVSDNSSTGYVLAVDRSANTEGAAVLSNTVTGKSGRYVKLTVTGAHTTYTGNWVSISEFRVFGSSSGLRIATLDESSSSTAGENELAKQEGAVVYPIPAQDVVCFGKINHIQAVELVNLSGSVFTFVNPGNCIDVSKMAPGKYILKIKTNEEVIIKNVIKQ